MMARGIVVGDMSTERGRCEYSLYLRGWYGFMLGYGRRWRVVEDDFLCY